MRRHLIRTTCGGCETRTHTHRTNSWRAILAQPFARPRPKSLAPRTHASDAFNAEDFISVFAIFDSHPGIAFNSPGCCFHAPLPTLPFGCLRRCGLHFLRLPSSIRAALLRHSSSTNFQATLLPPIRQRCFHNFIPQLFTTSCVLSPTNARRLSAASSFGGFAASIF